MKKTSSLLYLLTQGEIMRLKFFTIIILFAFAGCKSPEEKFVDFNNDKLEYMGRVGFEDSCSVIYWSGSSVEIQFSGTNLKALLEDEKGKNYFNVIVDDDSVSILYLDTTKRYYTLVSELKPGKHSVKLFKRTEWSRGETKFYGFHIENNTEIFNIPTKEKTIEFYGNSITAGYGVEDYSGNDSPDSIYTNNYNSYAAITARHFDVNYSCIAKSGIGITISWFPLIMKELYYRLEPNNVESKWDFTKSIPNVVVINLFQNDSWLVKRPEFPEFKHRFGTTVPTKDFIINAYSSFVKTIREKYPDGKIICMLGNMDITRDNSAWPGYVANAVASLNDKNIYTLFVPYKNSPGHPKVEEQKVLADTLINFIEKNNLFR